MCSDFWVSTSRAMTKNEKAEETCNRYSDVL